MVQPSQQHVAPRVKWIELGLIVTAFWAGIPVSSGSTVDVIQEAGVVLRHRCAAIGVFSLDCRGYTEGRRSPTS